MSGMVRGLTSTTVGVRFMRVIGGQSVRLRALARDRDCQIRLPGVCNGNRESVVLAHIRLPGVSGFGIKAPDLIGAWACSACHTYVDTHKDDKTKVSFYEGFIRTLYALIEEGEVGERSSFKTLRR